MFISMHRRSVLSHTSSQMQPHDAVVSPSCTVQFRFIPEHHYMWLVTSQHCVNLMTLCISEWRYWLQIINCNYVTLQDLWNRLHQHLLKVCCWNFHHLCSPLWNGATQSAIALISRKDKLVRRMKHWSSEGRQNADGPIWSNGWPPPSSPARQSVVPRYQRCSTGDCSQTVDEGADEQWLRKAVQSGWETGRPWQVSQPQQCLCCIDWTTHTHSSEPWTHTNTRWWQKRKNWWLFIFQTSMPLKNTT